MTDIPALRGNPLLPAFDRLLRDHPLPWRAEGSFIRASDGVFVAQCESEEEAKKLIIAAELRTAELVPD